MPAGRPKKTLQQRVKDGTYDFKKHGPLPPELASAVVPPRKPEGLSDRAAALWAEVLETRRGCVREADGPALEILCRWWGMYHDELDGLDGVPSNLKGQAFTRLGIATDKLERLMARFGMTPQDRAKVPDGPTAEGPAAPKVATRQPTKLDKAGPPKPGGK